MERGAPVLNGQDAERRLGGQKNVHTSGRGRQRALTNVDGGGGADELKTIAGNGDRRVRRRIGLIEGRGHRPQRRDQIRRDSRRGQR